MVDQYQDDVSTLGDPMFGAVVGPGGISPGLEKDETVAPRYGICHVAFFAVSLIPTTLTFCTLVPLQ